MAILRDPSRNQRAAALWQHMQCCAAHEDTTGWEAARTQLFEMFETLSFNVARRYLGQPSLSPEDLRQECRLATLKAIDEWSPERGEFPVLLIYKVRKAIYEYLRNNELIRRSTTLYERHQRQTLQGETAAATAPIPVLSFHPSPVSETDLADTLGTTDPAYARIELQLAVDQALGQLPADDRRYVALYLGLDGQRPHSFRQIAALLNQSHQHAKNRLDRALPRLRSALQGR